MTRDTSQTSAESAVGIRQFISNLPAGLIVAGDITGEFITTYQSSVAILNILLAKTGYDLKVINRLISGTIASVNAIGDGVAGNENIKNAFSSFNETIQSGQAGDLCNRDSAISLLAYTFACAAASPEVIFNLKAGRDMANSEYAAAAQASQYISYLSAPAMGIAHALFYAPEIKKFLSHPRSTLKEIYSSVENRPLANNVLRLVGLACAVDRIAEFTNTEFKDMLKIISDEELTNALIIPLIIPLATLASMGLAPITFSAMDKVANNFYEKLSLRFQSPSEHTQLIENGESLEASQNDNRQSGHVHNHGHEH